MHTVYKVSPLARYIIQYMSGNLKLLTLCSVFLPKRMTRCANFCIAQHLMFIQYLLCTAYILFHAGYTNNSKHYNINISSRLQKYSNNKISYIYSW